MKPEDHREPPAADSLQQILSRDGFSPDLPDAFVPGGDSAGLGWGLKLLMYMMSGVRIGTLDIELPNGSRRRFQGQEPGPHGLWRIKSERLMRHLLLGGEVGIGDAYLDDCWDTPDLTQLLMVMYLNEPHYKGPFEFNRLGRLWGMLKHKLKSNSKRTARKNIEYHYDLGNAFYKLWLDDTMAYSSAVFQAEESRPSASAVFRAAASSDSPSGVPLAPNETLMDAQLNKFRLIYERLDLKPEHTLLEIGSGWGGFAIYAAKQSGCRVHSITLSSEQYAEARMRAEQAGVADRVTFEIRDYRDVTETYDRVVSIEMYEAVGEEYWPGYFAAISKALKPGGVAAIQGITINPAIFENYRTKRDFIQKYIFPGGMLCPPGLFQDHAIAAGLAPRDPKFFARDYADTLAAWHRNVLAVREPIVEQFDERFLRMWRYYLSYCECGFRTGSIDLMHITLGKPSV